MKRIAILGSTGSIGTQALNVIRRHRDLFSVEVLCAGSNADLLIAQALEFEPNAVAIADKTKYQQVQDALASHDIKVFCGMDSVADLMEMEFILRIIPNHMVLWLQTLRFGLKILKRKMNSEIP